MTPIGIYAVIAVCSAIGCGAFLTRDTRFTIKAAAISIAAGLFWPLAMLGVVGLGLLAVAPVRRP